MLQIDGSYGEGGGQILRTALALSCFSGKGIEITGIRKSRPRPGLQPQHLTAVKAAAAISGASVEGADISSSQVRFLPGPVRGDDYHVDVSLIKGSAGSTSLVLQTIMLPLFFADRPSTVTLAGGTHVPWSPTFHYLKHSFLPVLSKISLNAGLNIEKWGWYPIGGGRIRARIEPGKRIAPVTITERGTLRKVRGVSAASNLPGHIAERQRAQAIKVLSRRGLTVDIEIAEAPSPGKGTLLFLLAEFENVSSAFDSLGALGKRAETVADEACNALFEYLESEEAAFEPHLADQIVPYLAIASGTSEFTTSRITRHLFTNIWVVKQFVDADIRVEGSEGEAGKVIIRGA